MIFVYLSDNTSIHSSMHWHPLTKFAFRFGACYIFLYTMSNQFIFSFALDPLWQAVVPWFAEHILHLPEPITVFTNGSGDTTYNWVSLLVYLIIAGIASLIWSSVDAKRPNYEKLLQWLLVLVRYYLIYEMVLYGLAKVFYMQFRPPMYMRLMQSFGDASPMGLLWTFMGFSKGYTIFAGLGELIGGLLLLFHRTRTLGALVIAGVMANVVMMNFCYDVPVKILSSHILLLAIFLIALDGKRLWQVFVANESSKPLTYPPLFANPKHEKIKNVVKWLIVIAGLIPLVYNSFNRMQQWGDSAPKPALYGLYEVERFERNGVEIAPLTTDSTRWDKLAIDWKDRAVIQQMTGKRTWYVFEPDTVEHLITHHPTSDTTVVDTFRYHWIDAEHIRLEGIQAGDTLQIEMKTKRKDDFLLMNRGFHWINESPFNR